MCTSLAIFRFFFVNDTATTEIYTLSLHDALPIYCFCRTDRENSRDRRSLRRRVPRSRRRNPRLIVGAQTDRSEEHTSELQSQSNLVCRLLLEKKKKVKNPEPR